MKEGTDTIRGLTCGVNRRPWRQVAVKVPKPDVERQLLADLSAMRKAAELCDALGLELGFDSASILREYEAGDIRSRHVFTPRVYAAFTRPFSLDISPPTVRLDRKKSKPRVLRRRQSSRPSSCMTGTTEIDVIPTKIDGAWE